MSLINRRSLMMNMEDNEVKEWRQIADIVLEEEKQVIVVDKDLEGNSFELEEFRVFIHVLPNEGAKTSANIRIGINSENNNDAIAQPNGGVPSSGYRKYDLGARRIGQNKWAVTVSRASVNTLLNFVPAYCEDEETVTDRAKTIVVNFITNAGIGTTIRIYGK